MCAQRVPGMFCDYRALNLEQEPDLPSVVAEGFVISLALSDNQVCITKAADELITAVIEQCP